MYVRRSELEANPGPLADVATSPGDLYALSLIHI